MRSPLPPPRCAKVQIPFLVCHYLEASCSDFLLQLDAAKLRSTEATEGLRSVSYASVVQQEGNSVGAAPRRVDEGSCRSTGSDFGHWLLNGNSGGSAGQSRATRAAEC